MKPKNIISVVLLTIYSLVLLHSIIPHHHHHHEFGDACKIVQVKEDVCDCDHDNHEHSIIADSKTCCNEHGAHSACHFKVDKQLLKEFDIDLIAIVPGQDILIYSPVEQRENYQYHPDQKQKRRSKAPDSLRAPPVC